jgi:hypothetical protein
MDKYVAHILVITIKMSRKALIFGLGFPESSKQHHSYFDNNEKHRKFDVGNTAAQPQGTASSTDFRFISD